MTVASILRLKGTAVYTIGSGQMLAEAAKVLSDRRIGAVVVTDDLSRVQGVLGEREIIGALAASGPKALTEPVGDYMLKKIVTCRRSDSVEALAEVMTNRRIRHIPVVEEEKLVGIVSIGDVVKHRMKETEMEVEAIRDYIGAH